MNKSKVKVIVEDTFEKLCQDLIEQIDDRKARVIKNTVIARKAMRIVMLAHEEIDI